MIRTVSCLQFRIVHAVRISKRWPRLRMRPHQRSSGGLRKDGTFLREKAFQKDTFGSGSVWDVVFQLIRNSSSSTSTTAPTS